MNTPAPDSRSESWRRRNPESRNPETFLRLGEVHTSKIRIGSGRTSEITDDYFASWVYVGCPEQQAFFQRDDSWLRNLDLRGVNKIVVASRGINRYNSIVPIAFPGFWGWALFFQIEFLRTDHNPCTCLRAPTLILVGKAPTPVVLSKGALRSEQATTLRILSPSLRESLRRECARSFATAAFGSLPPASAASSCCCRTPRGAGSGACRRAPPRSAPRRR